MKIRFGIIITIVLMSICLWACSTVDNRNENVTNGENTTLSEDNSTEDYNIKQNTSSMEIIVTIDVGENEKINYKYCDGEDGVKFIIAPMDFMPLYEGGFIVLAPTGDYIIKCDSNGDVTRIEATGYEMTSVSYTQDNEIAIKTGVRKFVILNNDGTFKDVTLDDITIKSHCDCEAMDMDDAFELVRKENASMSVVRCDKAGNIYTHEDIYDEKDNFICKYDNKGNLIEYITYSNEECVTALSCPIYVDESGNIFIMQCYENEIQIKKVTLQNITK